MFLLSKLRAKTLKNIVVTNRARCCFSWKHTKHKISSLDWIGSPHNNWSRQRDCSDNVLDMFPWKHS